MEEVATLLATQRRGVRPSALLRKQRRSEWASQLRMDLKARALEDEFFENSGSGAEPRTSSSSTQVWDESGNPRYIVTHTNHAGRTISILDCAAESLHEALLVRLVLALPLAGALDKPSECKPGGVWSVYLNHSLISEAALSAERPELGVAVNTKSCHVLRGPHEEKALDGMTVDMTRVGCIEHIGSSLVYFRLLLDQDSNEDFDKSFALYTEPWHGSMISVLAERVKETTKHVTQIFSGKNTDLEMVQYVQEKKKGTICSFIARESSLLGETLHVDYIDLVSGRNESSEDLDVRFPYVASQIPGQFLKGEDLLVYDNSKFRLHWQVVTLLAMAQATKIIMGRRVGIELKA
ncbi:hypothetical protein FVE85_5751 [Porphyridium purpureum]|uniref:Uncharacterized protein n=1 Tax=Porphyridium purpureum TaxID=35688 RepID=A0A5J4Z3I1_PORPP|nr:hypothetical protein FVE85_5751 [Porphyridium purpureum]|eukprot:POR1247..scf295_1